ncbi:MAG TPA: 50S ribosomal protein L31e [Candidatus Bathyarchaeia archaeon]|nr:50S ribosomal protein L31e [Candidatus Bathyarchaeia archaeon]
MSFETRIHTVNLARAWITPRYRRTDRVIGMIREFAKKSMKSDEVKLDQDLNRQIWRRGKTNPPRKIRLKLVKDEDGTVVVSLYDEAIKDEQDKSLAKDNTSTTKTGEDDETVKST